MLGSKFSGYSSLTQWTLSFSMFSPCRSPSLIHISMSTYLRRVGKVADSFLMCLFSGQGRCFLSHVSLLSPQVNLLTLVVEDLKGEEWENCRDFCLKMCCIILWTVISERLNLFHINHKIFDRHLCCKGFSVCWKYNFTRRKWFLGIFYSTNTDLRLPSIWDYHICAC